MYNSSLWSFRQGDYPACELFLTRTYRHRDISAPGYFGMGPFWHRDILALKHFSKWKFRHSSTFDCQNDCAETSIWLCMVPKLHSAETSMFQNILVPKCPSAVIQACCNVSVPKCPCAKTSSCRKFPVPKSIHDRMSVCRNVHGAEQSPCQNVPVMKYPCLNVSCRIFRCQKRPSPQFWLSRHKF